MKQKVIVLEVNEVPLRIFRKFAESRQGSNIHRLMSDSNVLETIANDVPETFLYPSQTWASLNTGAPYECHKVHWYNDPKPDAFPLYWKTIANNGRTVGAVNTLHSSPAKEFADTNSNYKFLIPDCFASDPWTKPAYFRPFQSLNLKAVTANSRAVSLRAPIREAALTGLNAPRYGIRARTIAQGASLVLQILQKKANRERLRNLQFPLVADIFLHQFRKHSPDLAILFTNHVAANMHRYWYGLFPEDYNEEIYDERWTAKYGKEISSAVALLDQYVGKFMEAARQNNRILIIVSSMGQHANQKLTKEKRIRESVDYRLEDVRKLTAKLMTSNYSFKVEAAMVPQYVLAFRNTEEATKAAVEMREAIATATGMMLAVDLNREVVTLSAKLNAGTSEFKIRGEAYSSSDLGYVMFEIEDHHSGRHCPEGSLIIYNSSTTSATSPSVDYLEYAPALLQHFGIEPGAYMKDPSFTF